MNKKDDEKNLVNNLEDCSCSLNELNTQIQTLYDVIKIIKDQKNYSELMQMYKQVYDSLGKHVESFNNLIRVVEGHINNAKHPTKKQ